MQYRITSILLIALAAILHDGIASASDAHIEMKWPPRWEYQPPQVQPNAVHFEARQNRAGRPAQQLRITVIDVSDAKTQVTLASVRALAERLRSGLVPTTNRTSTEIETLPSKRGYFFSHRNNDTELSPGAVEDVVDGVLLEAGYLVSFTLFTHDATSTEAHAMLSAIDHMELRD